MAKKTITGYVIRGTYSWEPGKPSSVTHKIGDVVQAGDVQIPSPTPKVRQEDGTTRNMTRDEYIQQLVTIRVLEPQYAADAPAPEPERPEDVVPKPDLPADKTETTGPRKRNGAGD